MYVSMRCIRRLGRYVIPAGLGQLMGMMRKRTHAQVQQKESCVSCIETGTTS